MAETITAVFHYGEGLTVKKASQAAPDAPTAGKVTSTSVTLRKTDGYQYSIDGTTWQDDNVFTGLTANKEYEFRQRIVGDDDHDASPSSPVAKITTTQYTLVFNYGDGGSGTMDPIGVNDGYIFAFPECTFNAPAYKQFDHWKMSGVDDTSNFEVSNDVINGIFKQGSTIKITDNCLTEGVITVTSYWKFTEAATVITPPAEKDLTYTGENQMLVNAGQAKDGTMKYALGTDEITSPDASSYADAIPTGTQAGTYYVWYKAVGNATHTDSAPLCVTAKINKRSVNLSSEYGEKPYDGTALTKPLVSGWEQIGNVGFVMGEVTDVKAMGSVTTVAEGEVKNAITYKEGASFNSDNYNITKTEGILVIRPKAVTVTVTATNRDYEAGNKIVSLTAESVNGAVPGDNVRVNMSNAVGEMADDTPGTDKAVTVTGVKLAGGDAGNYSLSAQPTGVTVNVRKADAPVVVTPTLEVVTYDSAKTLESIVLPAGWAWVTKTTVPTVSNNGYAAEYTIPDDTNYDYTNVNGYNAQTHKVTRTVALTVNKGTGAAATPASVSAWAKPDILNVTCHDELWDTVYGQEFVLVKKGSAPDWTTARELDKDGLIVYTGIAPATEYTIYTRVKETANTLAGEQVTTDYVTPLLGTGTIGDISFVGSTVTIVPDPEDAEGLTYQWYNVSFDKETATYTRGEAITGANGPTFTTTEADVGKYYEIVISKAGTELASSQYGPVNYGTVEFDTLGGNKIDDLTGTVFGGKITKPVDPIREGYYLVCWYNDYDSETQECSNEWNFEDDTLEFAFEILYAKWAEKQPAVVTTAPTAKTLTYVGSAQELVTAGEASGGTMYYALGENATTAPADNLYTTSIPTGTNAGTYYVWYKAVGDTTHSDSAPSVVTVTLRILSTEDFYDELRRMLRTAIALGGEQTVYWNKGNKLPYDIMKILEEHPQITLVYEYSYEGKDYKVTMPGRIVKAYTNIPWYGPLYLNAHYGKGEATVRTYVVKRGDVLCRIARRFHTTVKRLVELNGIKNPNRIWPGQVLRY